MRNALLLGIPVLVLCSTLPVWAQSTYVVDRLTDTGEGAGLNGDLRYCITNATSGLDTITFGVTGTINLTRALPDLATSVTIAGPGANQLTVRRNTDRFFSRIFTLTGAPTVVISGLAVAGGAGADGGGIYVAGGNLTITGSVLSNNGGPVGGGIYVAGGSVTITDSILSNNGAFTGGGIYVAGGNLTITGSVLSNNFAGASLFWPGFGGGIYVAGGAVSISNSTLSNNAAVGYYGADGGCLFEFCDPGEPGGPGRGGGIYVAAGAVSINNSTLSSNQAVGGNGGSSPFVGGAGGDGEGGGIYASGGTVKVFQNTLSANLSRGGNGGFPDGIGGNGSGGGLSISGGNVEVQHSTLSANQSTGGAGAFGGFAGQGSGGGLVFTAGTLRTRNTILAGNTAATTAPDVSGNLSSLGHNLISNSTGGSGFDPTDLRDVDPRLGPLQNNGGPTFTHALLPGSPAIDAGDNTGAPEWDQRGPGFRRIDIGTGLIDIGAFEVQ